MIALMLDYNDKEQQKKKDKCTIWREEGTQKLKVPTQAYAGREGIIAKEMNAIEEREVSCFVLE